ncbi:uncharacterized protein LOC126736307 [Anthonomus grandis grandis]|uniref:uncharacterized protein LOC126736307 n=1 Tax=Anthonomus grandis grandis TaxID=2921223 RepID=UPI002166164B|nr:uncharacterized protein LOC126736307 [Anthonomus grandis grandis]XP_050296557.1 uncharacterized protein LOC126736307 [Anthonomus grandis grandis]XP_050296558.1 uncharacterized protein LOC126736307 [Anthonomus grandis grandis]
MMLKFAIIFALLVIAVLGSNPPDISPNLAERNPLPWDPRFPPGLKHITHDFIRKHLVPQLRSEIREIIKLILRQLQQIIPYPIYEAAIPEPLREIAYYNVPLDNKLGK